MLVIEYAWNVFPSTTISSAVLLMANVFLLGGICFGYPEETTSASDFPKGQVEQ